MHFRIRLHNKQYMDTRTKNELLSLFEHRGVEETPSAKELLLKERIFSL